MSVITDHPEVLDAPRSMERKSSDKTVRIDLDLAKKVAFVCLRRSLTTAQYLSPMVREQIEADFAEETEAQHRELHARSKKKP